MKKWIFLLPLLLMACLCPAGRSLSTPTPKSPRPAPDDAGLPFKRVQLLPKNGDMQSQISAGAQAAAGLNLVPFVEFNASW